MFHMKNGVRFLGHPLHALLIHFPMGLLPISLLWDLIALLTGNVLWWNIAFWSIAAGLALALIAAVPGFVDFIFIPEHHSAEKPAQLHMYIMLIAVALYLGSFLFRLHDHSPVGLGMVGAIGLSLVGLISIVIGGWFGGDLVFHHEIGRKNLDK